MYYQFILKFTLLHKIHVYFFNITYLTGFINKSYKRRFIVTLILV